MAGTHNPPGSMGDGIDTLDSLVKGSRLPLAPTCCYAYLGNVLNDHIFKGRLAVLEEVGEVLALLLGAHSAANGEALLEEVLDGVTGVSRGQSLTKGQLNPLQQ